METAIIVTVYLQGCIGGNVSHTTKQIGTAEVSTKEGHSLVIRNEILHTDRGEMECIRKMNISSDAVMSWLSDCPEWEKPKHWKLLSKNQKIKSFVKRFDEGYGVDFEIVSLS